MGELASSGEAEAIYAKAANLESRAQMDEAERLYREFAALAPDDPRGPNKVGVCLALRREFDAAEERFRHALALDPSFPPALTNLGNILLERSQIDEAVALYEQALHEDAEYAPAHNNLAAALKRKGDFRQAVQHLRQAQRSARKMDRDQARREAQRGCSGGGATAVLLVAAGALTLGVFWR